MRNESHRESHRKTWIAMILDHVNAWRKAEGWSRETVVQQIVEAHERSGGAETTGIRFEPHTRDAFERCKVNADWVFRWLDDATKDANLLPTNFVPSILAALPPDRRMHCINDMVRDLGLVARDVGMPLEIEFDAIGILRVLISEDSEAQQSVASLADGATREELLTAQRELSESAEATRRALQQVEALLSAHHD